VILKIPRRDPSRRIPRRTRVRILERFGTRRIKTRRIRVLEHVEILSHEIAIHEFTTRSEPFILMDTWQRSAHRGKSRQGVSPSVMEVPRESPDRKRHPSEIGIREIGNRGDKESMHCENPNPENPTESYDWGHLNAGHMDLI
jgi:hypothetical protein